MTGSAQAKRRLAGWLAKRFFVRFHLSLILGFALAAGLLATKGFLVLGLDTMHWRWPLALMVAYGAFLLGVRLWLGYVGLGRYLGRGDDSSFDLPDPGVSFDGGGSGGSGLGDVVAEGVGRIVAGGGKFGGGGASGDFAAAAVESTADGGVLPDVSMPDIDLPDMDADEGCLPIIVLLLILALLLAVLGVGFYVVWQAPMLLAEVAFEAALAAGLVKPSRRLDDPGWIGGAVRASWLPFLLVFLAALAVAALAESFAPEARTLLEAVKILSQ